MKYLKTYNEKNDVKIRSNDGKTLDLSNLDLIELPELPKGLKYLYCEYNQLTKLPKLPEELVILYCHNNQLTKLPELPKGLKYLDCDGNKLTELPELPKGLKYLDCDGNKLPYDNLEEYWEWFWKENPDLYNANKMGLI